MVEEALRLGAYIYVIVIGGRPSDVNQAGYDSIGREEDQMQRREGDGEGEDLEWVG